MRPLEGGGSEVDTKPNPEASEAIRLVRLAVQADLTGRLLRRYKRFLVDIETPPLYVKFGIDYTSVPY